MVAHNYIDKYFKGCGFETLKVQASLIHQNILDWFRSLKVWVFQILSQKVDM
jgi:hypothetical protein